MPETRRLEPFPDELVDGKDLAGAISFLTRLRLPPEFARAHLRRFGQVTGIKLHRTDYARLGGRSERLERV